MNNETSFNYKPRRNGGTLEASSLLRLNHAEIENVDESVTSKDSGCPWSPLPWLWRWRTPLIVSIKHLRTNTNLQVFSKYLREENI